MPKMTSLIPHNYGGCDLLPGDSFDADPNFVRTLEVLGRAELARKKVRDEEPTPRALAASEPEPYKRRDLSAGATSKRKYHSKQFAN